MEKKIAKDLLSIGAVFLRPEQPSPGRAASKPDLRQPADPDGSCRPRPCRGGPRRNRPHEIPEAEVLMGTSTAGIAHAAIGHDPRPADGLCAQRLEGHGRGNRIEGRLEKGPEGRRDRGPRLEAVRASRWLRPCAKPAPRCWAWLRSSPTDAEGLDRMRGERHGYS
ncbi:MAG: hypothetical protein ACLRMJ_09890 [Alistipes finegoldii]